jgi:hypothetical protein
VFDWLETSDVKHLLELLRTVSRPAPGVLPEPLAPATVDELRLPILLAVAMVRRISYLLDLDSSVEVSNLLAP